MTFGEFFSPADFLRFIKCIIGYVISWVGDRAGVLKMLTLGNLIYFPIFLYLQEAYPNCRLK